MLLEHSAAMVSRPPLIKASPISQNTRQSRPATLALRALGSGLFFLLFVLCASPAFGVDLTLAWDPNTESDLEGYGVYFRKGAPGPPYDLFGYVATAELDDPTNPSFTITGLTQGARYYIALTAYDTAGAESAYSSSVCAEVGDTIVPCSSADTGGGGGGGGAACFIGTSLGDSGRFDLWIAGLTALAGLAALTRIAQRRFKRSFLCSTVEARKRQRRPNPGA